MGHCGSRDLETIEEAVLQCNEYALFAVLRDAEVGCIEDEPVESVLEVREFTLYVVADLRELRGRYEFRDVLDKQGFRLDGVSQEDRGLQKTQFKPGFYALCRRGR